MPVSVMAKIKDAFKSKKISREQYFHEYELELELKSRGPYWLNDEKVAILVIDSLLFNDKKEYDLNCATLMGNHVHVVLETFKQSSPLEKILQNHKKFTARHANILLNRTGQFWEEETFDTVIRDNDHFWNCVNYCIQNPVKAGFVKNWKDWKWTYIKPGLLKFIR